jgi:hypothetical protein
VIRKIPAAGLLALRVMPPALAGLSDVKPTERTIPVNK